MLRTLRALSVTMAACWFCAAAASAAERGAAMRFHIPAQSLDGALNAFAETAGVQLSYPGTLSEGLRSPALSGRYSVDQALEQLLEGTGLGYRFVADRTLTLERHDALAALFAEAQRPIDYAQATEPAPDKPQAPPRKDEQGPTTLPEMTVTASPLDETSYNPPNATTGITPAAGGRSLFDPAFTIRGFNNIDTSSVLGSYYYRDGARLTAVPISIGNLDRIA